jgi:iron complex outermembrane receptor protein
MKKSIWIFLILNLTFMMAQNVSGTVTDEDGNGLAGANVTIDGTSLGAAADATGVYSISGVAPGNYTVTASFIGYNSSSQTVNVGQNGANANFSLSASALAASEISVIGSRFAHTAEEQAVPVDVFTAAEIRRAGYAETAQILQALAPSFNLPRTSITDGSDTVRPMTLRGLGSGQVLVLVNGKRRHTTALVHVNNSPSRGDTGVDLNAIPAAAIERIEVLRDGAAAQYGSDAIAGVINIILKSGDSGGSFTAYGGTNNHVIKAMPDGYDVYGFKNGTETEPYTWNPTTDIAFSRDADGTPHGIASNSKDYTVNDGEVMQYQFSKGFNLGNDGSLLLAAEYRTRGFSTRTGVEGEQYYEPESDYWSDDEAEAQRLQPGSNWYIDPYRMIWGDHSQENLGLMYNADLPSNERRYYAFGGYTVRNGDTGCFTRQPDQGNKVWLSSNPTGFVPHIQPTVTDGSSALGVEGVAGNWSYDLSMVNGYNDFHFFMNSTNASYGPEQLRKYDIGGFKFFQQSINGDGTTNMGGIDLAAGFEYRTESFRIYAGETASFANGQAGTSTSGWDSYTTSSDTNGVAYGDTTVLGLNQSTAGSGCQCFSGFKPSNATATQNANRSVMAGYVDTEMNMGSLRVGVAGRFEMYNDTQQDGSDNKYNSIAGKVSARYELSEGMIFRVAASNGFRAPALAQSYQAKIATNFLPDPVTGETIAYEVGTFPTSHPFAQALGAEALKPEKSVNLSGGGSFIFGSLRLNVDAYMVNITDRIVLTGNWTAKDGSSDALEQKIYDLLQASGETNATGGRFFTNAVDTKTQGVDITGAYNMDLGGLGSLDLSLGMNMTTTELVGDPRVPTGLGDFQDAAASVTFDSKEERTMTATQPKDNIILGVNWNEIMGLPLSVRYKFHRFGEYHSRYSNSSESLNFDGVTYFEYDDGWAQVFGAENVMDLELSVDVGAMNVALGINNLTDEMPDKVQMASRANDGAFVYPNFSPIGMAGRFTYLRTSFNF